MTASIIDTRKKKTLTGLQFVRTHCYTLALFGTSGSHSIVITTCAPAVLEPCSTVFRLLGSIGAGETGLVKPGAPRRVRYLVGQNGTG